MLKILLVLIVFSKFAFANQCHDFFKNLNRIIYSEQKNLFKGNVEVSLQRTNGKVTAMKISQKTFLKSGESALKFPDALEVFLGSEALAKDIKITFEQDITLDSNAESIGIEVTSSKFLSEKNIEILVLQKGTFVEKQIFTSVATKLSELPANLKVSIDSDISVQAEKNYRSQKCLL
jgi:hypothetical protein